MLKFVPIAPFLVKPNFRTKCDKIRANENPMILSHFICKLRQKNKYDLDLYYFGALGGSPLFGESFKWRNLKPNAARTLQMVLNKNSAPTLSFSGMVRTISVPLLECCLSPAGNILSPVANILIGFNNLDCSAAKVK